MQAFIEENAADPQMEAIVLDLAKGFGRLQQAVGTVAGKGMSNPNEAGAAAMDLLLQMQADQLGVTVRRPVDQEATALGAAYLAGLAEGAWGSLDDVAGMWQEDAEFVPAEDREAADAAHQAWLRAVGRSRHWAED